MKTYKLLLPVVVILSLIGPTVPSAAVAAPAAPAVTLALDAQSDAWVDESLPTSNYGADKLLNVDRFSDPKATYNLQSLVWFDLGKLPPDAVVLRARLSLYQVDAQGPDRYGIWPDAIWDKWDERGVISTINPITDQQ